MRCETIHMKEYFPFLGEEGKDPLLTVYLPEPMWDDNLRNEKRPCVLICPGGGYGFVSDREAEPIAMHFLPEGYVAFVLTYSIVPHCFPAQLREVAAAMELITQNAALWQCDASRVAICGFSAGGHLAAHYSNAFDIPEVRAVFPESKPVQASILSYPVITADPDFCHQGSFENLVGHAYPMSQEERNLFSCDRLVTDRTPPAFLWHTAADETVPVSNSLLYAQALAKHGVRFALHIYPNGQHGLSTADHMTNAGLGSVPLPAHDWLQQVKTWLKATL